uniref:PHD-type zinc finger plants domain-containing protein n=1 Tax=Picea sitchensis TaxID=3332 RepID=D5ADF0_PICSI|nr:unknown [Picea sitchensis]
MANNSWRSSSMDQQPSETLYYSSRENTNKGKIRECCMCGNVGFQERLFRCHRCHHRFQHIYCSRLYSDELEFDSVNVCDWCLDLQAKEKIQRQKRKAELQEMESGKAKEVAATEASAMKQSASVTIEKPRKANTKPTLKIHVKFVGSKERQPPSSLIQDCMLSSESCKNLPGSPRQSSPTKGGLGRRYKLLSDVLC